MAEANREGYEQGVHTAWVGEIQGELFFNALAEAEVGNQREKWETLALLERVTGYRMAAVLRARGMPLALPEASGRLLAAAREYAKRPFAEAVSAMRPILLDAVGKFEALLAQAPAAEREAMQFLVDHERAILRFVDLEAAGQGDASLDAALALIAQSVAEAASHRAQPRGRP